MQSATIQQPGQLTKCVRVSYKRILTVLSSTYKNLSLLIFLLKLDSEGVVVGSARRVIVGPEGTCGDRAAAVSALVADFRDIALAGEAGDSLPTGFFVF